MSTAPRSVQQPDTAEDLFDQLDGFQRARDTLDSLGLLAPNVATALDDYERSVTARLATAIRFDPGAPVRLVDHDGTLFAYAELDGAPSFTRIEPVKAAEIALEAPPVPS